MALMQLAVDRPLDLEDLYETPDDGNCYQILDGALVVTPPPGTSHQAVSGELFALLRQAARPAGFRVFSAPIAWRIGPGQIPEPDLIVASSDVVTERAVEGPPVLVVEILSPSGKARDLIEKRRIYAEGQAPWYWILDPSEPSLLVLHLVVDTFVEEAVVKGLEAYETDLPFPIRVVPAELLY